MKTILIAVFVTVACLAAWPAQIESHKPARTLVFGHADLKLTPAALVFASSGKLYVGYRHQGSKNTSSAIWVRVLDPATGNEVHSAQLQTAAVRLPNSANQFLLSPDNSLLLYSQFSGSTLVAILDASTLQKVSEATNLPDDMGLQYPKVVGIDASNHAVLISAEILNHLNGTDARLVKLDTHELSHVLSDTTLPNPIPESGFTISDDGTLRIIRADMLYSYDASTRKAVPELSVHNEDDIRNALVLGGRGLLLWSGQNEFGYLYRFKPGGSTPEASQRIEKSSVVKVLVSSDHLYGVAVCEHQRLTEGNFGAITSRTAAVFDTKTLKIISEVPIEKDLYPEIAIWHGDGKIVIATQANSNKLAIYELAEPKP